MALATRFNNANKFQSENPISDQQLRKIAPSIFAPAAHESRSQRYAYIPTSVVLDNLRKEGFFPFFVAQSRTRVEGKADFTKHMLRLRHASQDSGKPEAHEVIIINSHDGSSCYQLINGVFRFVCTNGMVTGDVFEDFRIQHTGKVVDQVIEASYQIMDQSKLIAESVDEMKSLQLSEPEQAIFAEAALTLRYPELKPEELPVTPSQMLRPQRGADQGADLWRTFNRVQENTIRGGLRATPKNGRRGTTRAVNGIDQSTTLNRALWTLAEKMKDLKAA